MFFYKCIGSCECIFSFLDKMNFIGFLFSRILYTKLNTNKIAEYLFAVLKHLTGFLLAKNDRIY